VAALYAVIGVALLIFGLAFAWSRSAKKRGRSEAERDALEEGADARERQSQAERTHAATGDLNDDARFLRDAAARGARALHDER